MKEEQLELFKKDILSAMSTLLDSKNYSTKDDIKGLEQQITELKVENEALKKEMKQLKEREEQHIKRMDYVENQLKANNLIIKGVEEEVGQQPLEWVKQFFINVLGINQSIKVSSARIFKQSKRNGCNIIITMEKIEDVYEILKQTKKLRDTPYTVDRDLCFNSRQKRGKLLALRKEIKRINAGTPVTVRNETIIIDSHKFYWHIKNGPVNKRNENAISHISEIVGQDMNNAVKNLLPGEATSKTTDAVGKPEQRNREYRSRDGAAQAAEKSSKRAK